MSAVESSGGGKRSIAESSGNGTVDGADGGVVGGDEGAGTLLVEVSSASRSRETMGVGFEVSRTLRTCLPHLVRTKSRTKIASLSAVTEYLKT